MSIPLARPVQHLERAVLAHAVRAVLPYGDRTAVEIAKERWPEDRQTLALLTKGTTSPALRGTSGWASQLSPDLVSDFVASLAPVSAAARLISAGMPINLAGKDTVKVPRRQSGAKPVTPVQWVAEGAPIPVKQYVLDAVTLGPACKLASISALSREAVVHASGLATVSTLLREDVSASLDAWMFSTQAGTAGTSPPGLLQGVSPLTASTATDHTEAMLVDLEKLAGVISDAGGSGVVFIAATRQAIAARLRLRNLDQFSIFPCASLAAGTVVCVEPSAFVSYISPDPVIDVGLETALHFEDTSPQPIAAGTGPTVASPVRSLFQQDLVAIKVLLEISYAMRAANMVSYLTGAAWG
jgi:hypothetical protein